MVEQAHDLVEETIATYGGERVAVTAVIHDDRAAVHAVSVVCLQEHPDDLIDPTTAGVLHEAAERWGADSPQLCLCTTLALLGDDWKGQRLFIAPRPRGFADAMAQAKTGK